MGKAASRAGLPSGSPAIPPSSLPALLKSPYCFVTNTAVGHLSASISFHKDITLFIRKYNFMSGHHMATALSKTSLSFPECSLQEIHKASEPFPHWHQLTKIPNMGLCRKCPFLRNVSGVLLHIIGFSITGTPEKLSSDTCGQSLLHPCRGSSTAGAEENCARLAPDA